MHSRVSLDMVDPVGLPGPVGGWDEKVSLDLREETTSIILHKLILSQKVAAEYRVFHFCTNKSVGKKLTS